MAIQIPQLKPLEPTQPQSVGRVNANPPDLVTPMAKQTRAATGLVEAAGGYAQKVEMDAADTEATRRSVEYEQYYKSQLYGTPDQVGIKFQEGDPTQMYRKLDEDMIQKYNELTGDENLSPYAKELVLKRLTDKTNQLETQKLTEFGYQQAKYDDNVATAGVETEKVSLMDAASYVKPGDETSFVPFDAAIGRIRDIRLRSGAKTGSVIPDDNGKSLYIGDDGQPMRVTVGPITSQRLSKDLSEGVYDAINNASKSGQVGVADALMKKYGDLIEPTKRSSLSTSIEKDGVDKQALVLADSTVGMTPDQIEKRLNKYSPEVKDKAYQAIDDRQRHMQNIESRSSKNNYNSLMGHIQNIQNSNQPYTTLTQLQNDPVYKNQIDKVTDPKQQKAILNAVVQPANTPTDIRNKMQALLLGDDPNYPDVRQMDVPSFGEYLAGMSKSDQNYYTRFFNRLKTETTGEEYQKFKAADKELENQLLLIGYIKKDAFNRISGSNEIKFENARNDLVAYLDKSGSLSPKELNEYVKKYAVTRQTGEVFTPPEQIKFQGTKKSQEEAVPQDNNRKIKGKTRLDWVVEFKKQYGRFPDLKTQELQNFIQKQE